MSERLNGTVALVPGASSGIGQATATALAAEGAAVVLAARRVDRLNQLASEIREGGGTATVMEADVTNEASARAIVERTVGDLGRLDILVNSAGVMLQGLAIDQPFEEMRRSVEVNIYGFLYLVDEALPHLLHAAETAPRRVADLVTISSVAGRTMRPQSAIYNATKHAIGAFSEALRQEVTTKFVRVGVIEPGNTVSELAGHNRPEVRKANAEKFVGVTFLEAADIADAIVYMVTRPRGVAVNEMLVRPTDQVF